MIEFERHSGCDLCPLNESATNPGLPTRPLYDGQPVLRDRAILFVGQSPGHHEDKSTRKNPRGKSFIGFTGQLLEKMVKASRLTEYCDIYLANSCRCKPPQGGNETQSYIRKCRRYLQEDVAKLQAQYKEVVIVNLGAKACYATLHINSLTKSLKQQAHRSHLFGPPQDGPRVFSTYHPAILHPMREPAKVIAVEAHFALLLRYLKGEFIPNELEIVPEVLADVPDKLPDYVSCDIETYGILAGVEQTVFHPVKSKEIDGIPFRDQVITVSFGWEEEGRIRTALYIFKYKAHRKKIREWFRKMSQQKVTCGGQNFKFDLLYLYLSGDQELPYWIDPRRLVVDDTLITGFLLYEQQPEKGLKEQAMLFGVADYSKSVVTGKAGNAKSCHDKNLHYYNCKDAAVTLQLRKFHLQQIESKFAKDSPKLSDTCGWMRNAIIWDVFDLEKNGSALNTDKLEAYHDVEEYVCKWLNKISEVTYGIKLAGKGSDAPLRQLMLDCVTEADLLSDSRVEWSAKTKKISIGVENVNLVREYLPAGRNLEVLSSFQEFKERSKIVTTYTRPILHDTRKGIVTRTGRTGIVFPSWYPVPLYANRGGSSDDKSGGQIQGRFSCKKPARQTEPRKIRDCSCSRWPGGTLIECDMSQDHLRMAALLSGDPVLMEAYAKEGESIHTRTALTIFPDADPTDPGWKKSDEYKLGKTTNFLVIFRGGAAALQRTALQDADIVVEIGFCNKVIKVWSSKHHVYWDWQNEMIDLAAKQGYLVLPTGWSRTFGLGHQNITGQIGEVLNFLHQCPCAQLTHSAHYKTKMEFLKYRLRSVICLNIYDSLFADIYPGEEKNVKEILLNNMSNPPLLPVFEQWVGRKINWLAEVKEYEK